MSVRRATAADREAVHRLYAEFFAELPPPPYKPDTLESELAEVDGYMSNGIVLIAEDGEAVGLALARIKGPREGYLSDLYVRQGARRRGHAQALIREVAAAFREQGVDHFTLDVDADNSPAHSLYGRLGFREQSQRLVVETAALEARLSEVEAGEAFGSVHVQTDDAGAVERAVAQFVPRLGRSHGTIVSECRNGWVAVYDELCDREPHLLRRLARELSDRMGAVVLTLGIEDGAVVRYVLFDRGRVADEYASLPEHHGPLPPGDVIALRANATVAARLTGADPEQIRRAARSGTSPAELPPPRELLAAVAAALHVEGADHGYTDAQG